MNDIAIPVINKAFINDDDMLAIHNNMKAYQTKNTLKSFKKTRQSLLDNAVIETSNGNKYDADETSINRLTIAVTATTMQPDNYTLSWSLADTSTGVMTEVTLANLREAQSMAAQNMASIWSINS